MAKKEPPKHKGEKKVREPKWVKKNPGAGRHGVPDKGAHQVGREWEKDREDGS